MLLGRTEPVAPDADQARRWAEDELSKAIYDDSPSWWQRLLDWFGELITAVMSLGGTAPPTLMPVILVVGFAALATLAFLLGGRVRRRRRAPAPASFELFDDHRSSEQLRAGADAAASAGDFHTAVLERFRSIIRSLDERAVLDDRPGLTAHEAAALATVVLPGCGSALQWAGQLFDDVRYGAAEPGPAHDQALRQLAGQVEDARPADRVGAR